MKKIFSLFIVLLLFAIGVLGQNKSIPEDFCITQKEYQLYELINQYRAKLMLEPITLSNSLCFVAKTHAKDLSQNYPIGEDCNMHSWSANSDWKSFCFPADQNRKNDIKDKAKELTSYPGKAWEITYWDNQELNLDNVVEFWTSIEYTAAMLSNTEKWKDKVWRSIGLGIYDGYVLLWLGEKEDVELNTIVCETGERIMNKSIPNELIVPVASQMSSSSNTVKAKHYYIIIGSYKKKADAQAAIDSYHQMGYPNAQLIEEQGRVRVAIDKLESEVDANESLAKYRNKFQGAWVFLKQ
ncbi:MULTISPECIES: SPOR domain-containing protein [unclassified Lentimicrobium]|uniref:SPOR domain-containing protein n=1 Tax=unclassified Lentimicrobium TaxID=2677434 RepID=UPI0015544AC2|nr:MULTISPECIES: SPOR domain-containing protein [unclassified Lentimicrobium]NPD44822.1 hypothetical protein [Lentimicrobium sp. S6]NPD83161.1 hypothetical protein [Lentimicrobium sp. L6]